MKQVTLVFPDTTSMTDFILIYKPPGAESNSVDISLKAGLSDNLISVACTEYGALPLILYSGITEE
jgi:hypothetical protein